MRQQQPLVLQFPKSVRGRPKSSYHSAHTSSTGPSSQSSQNHDLSSQSDPSSKPRSVPPDLPDALATIYVGPKRIPFETSIRLLTQRSAFFRKVFSLPFLEGTHRTVSLPHDHPSDFARALKFLMAGSSGLSHESPWLSLCTLWILADKLIIPALQNHVIALFPAKFLAIGGNVPPSCINYVFVNTLPGGVHPLRTMVVDICAWGMSMVDLRRGMEEGVYDRGFLEEIYVVLFHLETQGICTELAMGGMPWLGKGLAAYKVDEGIGDE